MNRWVWFFLCAILGLVMLVCGLLVPMHLRAVDAGVIERAGRNTPSLIDVGLTLTRKQQLGAARLMSQAADTELVFHREQLAAEVNLLTARHPELRPWDDAPPRWAGLFEPAPQSSEVAPPFTEFVVKLGNREKLFEYLRSSPSPVVQELLRTRDLTNVTVFLGPSKSASGPAFDAAVCIAGLLASEGHMRTSLRYEFYALANQANRGGSSTPLENSLLDLMSLGQRFDWGQLAAFTSRIEDTATLNLFAGEVRNAGSQLPALFAVAQMAERPPAIARYLSNFGRTGLTDAAMCLRYRAGGINELLHRDQRLYNSDYRTTVAGYVPFGAFFRFAADYAWLTPKVAMAMKWLFYLCGGFLIAAAMHFGRPAVSALERPLQVRGIHLAREFLFALGFLLVVLLLSEPFLAQDSQKVAFHFRLTLPMAGKVTPHGSISAHPVSFMNPKNLLTLLLFFVLQGLLYVACLVKLAEIRRQQVAPRMKLRLLENEDHLFDAGLYLGFVGTIVSLILASLGMIDFSLMSAYSSTSFGIVFVSLFKIFHLRPARRKLLLQAEAASPEAAAPAQAPSFATYS